MPGSLIAIALISGIHILGVFISKKDMPIISTAIFVIVCWHYCLFLSIIALVMSVWVVMWHNNRN